MIPPTTYDRVCDAVADVYRDRPFVEPICNLLRTAYEGTPADHQVTPGALVLSVFFKDPSDDKWYIGGVAAPIYSTDHAAWMASNGVDVLNGTDWHLVVWPIRTDLRVLFNDEHEICAHAEATYGPNPNDDNSLDDDLLLCPHSFATGLPVYVAEATHLVHGRPFGYNISYHNNHSNADALEIEGNF